MLAAKGLVRILLGSYLFLGVWRLWPAFSFPVVVYLYRVLRAWCSLMFRFAMAAGCAPSLLCLGCVGGVPVTLYLCTLFFPTYSPITGASRKFERVFTFLTCAVTFSYALYTKAVRLAQ